MKVLSLAGARALYDGALCGETSGQSSEETASRKAGTMQAHVGVKKGRKIGETIASPGLQGS